MGGGGTQQTTSTTASANPAVTATTTDLLKRLQGQVGKGTAVFGKSLNPGAGATTQNSWASMLDASKNTGGLTAANNWTNNAIATNGYNPALSGAQAGVQNYLDESDTNSPAYQALRARAGDDTLRDVNSMFTSSGRFGSGSHVSDATESLGNVYAGMDMQQYENGLARRIGGNQALAGIGQTAYGNAAGAANMAPGMYQAGLAPAGVQAGVGAAQDANALGLRQGENDLFRRENDAGWSTLGQASSILAGNASAAGQTTTNTSPATPWWLPAGQLALGMF